MSALLPADHPASLENRTPPKPSPIDMLCEAVVDRLKQKLPGKVFVDHFPDRPEQFDFEGYSAAALVLYDGSHFDRAGQLGAQGIKQEFRLVVSLLVRALRGTNGAYDLLHETRAALQGVSLAGSTGLYPLDAALERENEGVFQYRMSFAGALVAVPVKQAQVTLPRGFSSESRI